MKTQTAVLKKAFFLAGIIALAPSILSAQSDEAQEKKEKDKSNYEIKTLARGGNTARGGYFGFTAHYSRLQGRDAFTIGTRFAYLMNHVFAIGFSGSGFVNDIPFRNVLPGKEVYLQGGYGGLLLEPVVGGRFPVHLTFPVLIGGGAVLYNEEAFYRDFGNDFTYEDWNMLDADAFFVVEPGLNLEFNITKFFRIGLETKYRYVNGLQLMNTSPNLLNGWSGGLNFKVGKF